MPGRPVPEQERREQILRAAFEVAARDGLAGVTVRAVAAEAKVSHALVLFHFKRKDLLLHDLVDWVLASSATLEISEDIATFPRAVDRLHAILQQEMNRLAREQKQIRLFFEFWALGARQPEVRKRISVELEHYRAAIRSIMEELIAAEPMTFAAVTADGLAAVVVSWIHGCAVQATYDPEHFDTEEYFAAVRGIIGQFARSGPGSLY